MMGNDDCAVNMPVLTKHDGRLYNVIHGRRMPLADGFDIVGYSFVPITPFALKDWEKFDLINVPSQLKQAYQRRKASNYRLQGFRTSEGGFFEVKFTARMEKEDSIQKDFADSMYTRNSGRTVYVVHTPPDGTSLDIVLSGMHVGSFALRQFIEEFKPHLTLHGHIHEAVAVSGRFIEKIGNTTCITSGNHNEGSDLAVILFELEEPHNAKRVML